MRNQEYNLTIADLLQYPAWEYALDEEDVHGQNEKSLRPCVTPESYERDEISLLVRAAFILANGVEMIGFIKPRRQGGDQWMQPVIPYDLSPVIVTDRGHVTFCYGIFKPDLGKITESYQRLGYGSGNVFPIQFRTEITINNRIAQGMLEGFLYIEKDTQNFFQLKPTDVKSVR